MRGVDAKELHGRLKLPKRVAIEVEDLSDTVYAMMKIVDYRSGRVQLSCWSVF